MESLTLSEFLYRFFPSSAPVSNPALLKASKLAAAEAEAEKTRRPNDFYWGGVAVDFARRRRDQLLSVA